MAKHGKKYNEAAARIDRDTLYSPEEAIKLAKETAPAKFDETVEIHMRLGIDPRHSDQQVRGSISLPHGTGQERTVAVFADGAAADAAREAGADIVGADDLIGRVTEGFTGFDVALATPDMMSRIGRLGRFLGPRGLMPSPKSGTVRSDIGEAVQEFKAGKVEFRNDSGGNIHVAVGKISFDTVALAENVRALIEQLQRMRPTAAKGRYLRKVFVTSTMNPAVPVEIP